MSVQDIHQDTGWGSHEEAQNKCRECLLRDCLWHCDKCDQDYCMECYESRPLHQREQGHTRLPYSAHRTLVNILQPEWTDQERLHKHEEDDATTWFGVYKTPNNQLRSEILQRYSKLVAEYRNLHWGPGQNLACYPRLVSFVGSTNSGKSTLIRMLLETPWDENPQTNHPSSLAIDGVPVVRQGNKTRPTSGDVHLYGCDDNSKGQPSFYADCEGLNGGEEAPDGAFFQRVQSNSVSTSNNPMRRVWDFILRGAHSHVVSSLGDAQDESTRGRQAAISKLMPRLLYNFSDVVVFVVGSQESSHMANVLSLVLSWAQMSSASAVNRISLPHLVVALNKTENLKGTIWNSQEATEKIFAEHGNLLNSNASLGQLRDQLQERNIGVQSLRDLLGQGYASVEFIWIPNANNGHNDSLAFLQLKQLLGLINARSAQSQARKNKCGLLLASQDQEFFFSRAFNHYSNHVDEPFNLIRELMSFKPIPDGFMNNTYRFLVSILKAANFNMSNTLNVFEKVAQVIYSAIALDIKRSYPKVPGRVADIFRGNLLSQEEGFGQSSGNTYASCVRTAIKVFYDNYVPCGFQEGRLCVNTRISHQNFKYHQDKKGGFIGEGEFVSANHSAKKQDFDRIMNEEIQRMDSTISLAVEERVRNDDTGFKTWKSDLVWSIHRKRLKQLHASMVDLKVEGLFSTEHKMCEWCLLRAPFKLLPCGHAICPLCAVAECLFRKESRGPEFVQLGSCLLHAQTLNFESPFQMGLRPSFGGIRILSLDGGGVRGLLEVKLCQLCSLPYEDLPEPSKYNASLIFW